MLKVIVLGRTEKGDRHRRYSSGRLGWGGRLLLLPHGERQRLPRCDVPEPRVPERVLVGRRSELLENQGREEGRGTVFDGSEGESGLQHD